MEVRTVLRGAECELVTQRFTHDGHRMDVITEAGHQLGRRLRLVLVGSPPSPEPPCRSALVEAPDVELVDYQRASAPDEAAKATAGRREGLDMMKRQHGNRSVEARGRRLEVVQRDRHHRRRLRGGVNRHHLVAVSTQGQRQLARTRPDLEHSRRRAGELPAHERRDVAAEQGPGG